LAAAGESAFFNGFDGALCDAAEVADFLMTLLLDLPAFAGLAFARCVFADFTAVTGAALREAGLEDFLRVFLDIRLPFVAFGGSIMGTACVSR
jgi:hypothetical protein